MAYDRQLLRVRFSFTVTGTDEIADTGLTYSTAPGWTGAAAALAELAAADVGPSLIGNMVTLMDTTQAQWASYSELRSVKIAALGTDGDYLEVEDNPYIYEDPDPDSGASENILPQSTICCSLRSGFTTGKANYGRMYLPHTKIAQGTGLAVGDPTSALAVANAFRTFVNACTDDINAETTAVLFPVIASFVGSGTAKGVTEVAVGCVTDTQRRRRNALAENYQFVALA